MRNTHTQKKQKRSQSVKRKKEKKRKKTVYVCLLDFYYRLPSSYYKHNTSNLEVFILFYKEIY